MLIARSDPGVARASEMNERRAPVAMHAFVPLKTDGGGANHGTAQSRRLRPAQPVQRLWKDQLALAKIAMVAGAANVAKSLLVSATLPHGRL